MTKRMLIDASHPGETRVVVLNEDRLEEFDYESNSRKQLKGNIYLAKVTRVEPSLQAAFVEYGGNRQGFLSFSEIHPDYYRIPVADREALIAQEAEEAVKDNGDHSSDDNQAAESEAPPAQEADEQLEDESPEATAATDESEQTSAAESDEEPEDTAADGSETASATNEPSGGEDRSGDGIEQIESETGIDVVGGDDVEEDSRKRAQRLRRYKIQEVIKRRQVMLVQVSKEERGNKGAALTTYLSLAGRYCVLMPNTGKGGGISRKISNANDRRRLKKVISELDIPKGMAVIVRTAGSERSRVEIRRDYEYLVRLWNDIRETTLNSSAPCLIHEEANLIKRSLRDLYTRDMNEILVDGEDGYKIAKNFVKSMIPSHARKVQLFKTDGTPLLHHFKVEGQLDSMHSPVVQLRSGGYIVINPTEALVAIDVNSGKATRERHIEETALKTNNEAAQEIARQLRLRDLAGLIVIDFIDMEDQRHNRDVERRLKEAMKNDRARIQLGRISPFGLLELSRQRLRPSLFESSTIACSRCGGTGHIRSVESTGHHILRVLEEDGIRRGAGELTITVNTDVALNLMNQLRGRIIELEQRYDLKITIECDDTLISPDYRLSRLSEPSTRGTSVSDEAGASPDDGKRRRGRRGRRRKEEPKVAASADETSRSAEGDEAADVDGEAARDEEQVASDGQERGERSSKRRRGKRGGRRRSRRRRDETGERTVDENALQAQDQSENAESAESTQDAETAEPVAAESETGPAPKKRRSRRGGRKANSSGGEGRQAKKSDDASDNAAASSEAGEPEANGTAGAEDQAQPKRKAQRSNPRGGGRSRKAAQKEPEEPSSQPEQKDAAPSNIEADDRNDSPPPEGRTSDDRIDTDVGVAAVASSGTTAAPDGPANDPNAPKRRGWWQRWV